MNNFTRMEIVGVFRSGTNAMLETLERGYYCIPTFNQYFWKHCLPPSTEVNLIPRDTAIICMVRDPVEWNRSIFRFWHTRRKELTPSLELGKFIREPLLVYDNSKGLSDIHYHFNTPIDYWNKYYYAWYFWKNIRDQLLFVRLEDFETKPESVLLTIERKFSLRRKTTWSPTLPPSRVGPLVPSSIEGLITEYQSSDINFIQTYCLPNLKSVFNY